MGGGAREPGQVVWTFLNHSTSVRRKALTISLFTIIVLLKHLACARHFANFCYCALPL